MHNYNTQLEMDFLEKFLKNSSFSGWNLESFYQSSLDLGLDKNYGFILFPRGVEDIITAFNDMINDKLSLELDAEEDFHSLKIREKIQLILLYRFKEILPYKQAFRQLQGYYQIPYRFGMYYRDNWKISDLIWNICNDRSVDLNYYSKRLILAKIHKGAIDVFLADESPELSQLEDFIKDQIKNVMKFEKVKTDIKKNIKKIPFVRLLFKSH